MDIDILYKYDEPLDPEHDFLILERRWRQLNEVITGIRQGRFWAIYGPRKIGKTTFLKQIYDELSGAYLCVHIDFTNSPKGSSTFYNWLIEKIMKALPAKLPYDFNIDIHDGQKDDINFFRFLSSLTLNKNANKNKLVFLFDEIEKVNPIDTFLGILRMVHEGRNTDEKLKKYQSIVVTGSMNLMKLSAGEGETSPFNIARKLYLKDFSREETWQFIDKTFSSLEERIKVQTKNEELVIIFEEDAKEELYDYLSGHPQMLQHALHILANKAEEERRSINKEDVDDAIDEIYRENSSLKTLKRQVRSDEILQKLIVDILHGNKIPYFAFEEYTIKGAGAIKEDENKNCVIRNRIFKKYLTNLRLSKSLYLELVEELMRSTVTAGSFEDLSQNIVDKCADFLNTEICTLWRKVYEDEQDKLILAASNGFSRPPGESIPSYTLNRRAQKDDEIKGLTAWIAVRKESIRFNSYSDLIDHPSYLGALDRWAWLDDAEKKFRNLIGVPLLVNQKIVGVIKWENGENPEGLSDEDYDLAQKLAPFIAIALEAWNSREKRIHQRQESLRELAKSMLKTSDQKELNQQIVNKTASLLNADVCTMWLCDNEKKILKLAEAYGIKSEDKNKITTYQLNWDVKEGQKIEGLTTWVAISGEPFYTRNFEELTKHSSWRGEWDKYQWGEKPEKNFSSLYAVPLIIQNEVLGVLKIARKHPKTHFSDVDRTTFDLMANFIELSLELNSRLRRDVIFDFFHLLKQPASNAIMTFSELRRELDRPQGPRKERIDKRLMQLARNLESIRGWTYNVYALATARVTGQEEDAKNVNIRELINDSIDELRHSFPDFNCKISNETKFYSVQLTDLEQKKFHVIFYNILFNSIKYSSDKPEVKVKIKIADNNDIVLSIKDNGQGISKEDLPYIFERYFTRGAKKWPETLGLGLTTVARLLEEFAFEKKVKSKVNKGTEFTILIPKIRWRRNAK